MEHPFTWYSLLPYPLSLVAEPNFTAVIVALVLIGLALAFRKSLQRSKDPVVPEPGITARNVMEVLVEIVLGLSDGIIGKKGREYVPLFGTLFLFILIGNFFGLIPGVTPPTSSFFSNLGMGLVVFVAYHNFGVRENGAPLFILIEFFSHIFRPISLSIRLFGNMFGDHLVLEIFSNLTKLVIPVAFYILGSLVSVIQAAVFTILSVIYVAMAISHEH
jgi:F-type H+-transporting ATPase subunit a